MKLIRHMVNFAVPSALLLTLGSPAQAQQPAAPSGQMGFGTESRHWLQGSIDPPVVGALAGAKFKAVELAETNARLIRDPVTGVWGVPVSRRGDPDYAPGNPKHSPAKRDEGLVLPARVWAPNGAIDPSQPCILTTNGYGIGQPGGAALIMDLTPFAEHGYTSVSVALRQASLDPLSRQIGVSQFARFYGEDGVEIINWIILAYGCGMTGGNPATAKVGMVGPSLLGLSQWSVLKQADFPPALKAIAPDVAGTTFYDLWFPGGMLPGPGRIQRAVEFSYLFPDHRDFDPFWRQLQLTQAELARAASRGVAVLFSGGWPDYISPGAIETYSAYRSLSRATPKKLFIGPTGHPTPAPVYASLAIQWMDYWLKGEKNAIDRDPVTIFVQGPNRWRAEDAWPIPDAKTTRLYFRNQAGDRQAATGSLLSTPPVKDAPFAFDYDPDRGPFLKTLLGSPGLPKGGPRPSIDQAPDEMRVANWTSEPLSQPTEITGVPTLSFWASSSTADADFVVDLADVSPDGVSRSVTPGYLNAQRGHYVGIKASLGPPKPLKPGEPQQFTVTLYPTSYVFATGHRIRIAIAGGTDIAIGEDGAAQSGPQGPGKNPNPFSVRIFQDAQHVSYVDFPVIGIGLSADPAGKRGN